MKTVIQQAEKNVAQYCERFRDTLQAVIDYAASHKCGAMVETIRGKNLPKLMAFGAEDVFGNVRSVALHVVYCTQTQTFDAFGRNCPGVAFRIDGSVV
jgi:hypothetical protein